MRIQQTIQHVIQRYGRETQIHSAEGPVSPTYQSFLQPLRYKNKMYLGGINTRIGFNREGYYLYLGPPEQDLTTLPTAFWIVCGGESFTIDRAELVYFADEKIYLWAIVRSMVE